MAQLDPVGMALLTGMADAVDAEIERQALGQMIPGKTRIKFKGERLRYTVRATNGRFVICTKPFNVRHTTIYSIIDFRRWVRGRENLIFGMGFETDEQIAAAMQRLTSGESEVSYRHCVNLEIEEISAKA